MEKELTLRERYDQINQLIVETRPQRERFREAEEAVKKKARLYAICAKIMHEISYIHNKDSWYNTNDGYYYSLGISNEIKVTLYQDKIKETEKEELQKIIDEYSPEKVRIAEIVEENASKYSEIEVELV